MTRNLARFSARLNSCRSRGVSGKDAINVNRQIGELEARLAKLRIEGAAAVEVLAKRNSRLPRRGRTQSKPTPVHWMPVMRRYGASSRQAQRVLAWAIAV